MDVNESLIGQSEIVSNPKKPLGAWMEVIHRRERPHRYEVLSAGSELPRKDLILYRVEEITYEEDSPQLEALENALSCMAVPGMNLVYLILGDHGKVQFYFGFARDTISTHWEGDQVLKVGEAFLKPAIVGNFRGSIVRRLNPDEIQGVRNALHRFFERNENCRVLGGVPGGVKDKENQDFRGIDRLVDIMQGDSFAFMILAKPISQERLSDLRADIFTSYEMLAMASKQSVQLGVNDGTSQGTGTSEGTSESRSLTHTDTTSRSDSSTKRLGSRSSGASKTEGGSKSRSDSNSDSKSTNRGTSTHSDVQHGSSVTVNSDLTNKVAADWVKYFDEVLIPRLDYARGKGAYVVNMTLLGENPQVVRKLSQAARSIFAGEMANMVPLLSREPDDVECRQLENFSIPYERMTDEALMRLPYARAGLLEYDSVAQLGKDQLSVLYSGNWMSVRELALMAGLPQKEVVGLRLKEEVEFGLNVPEPKGRGGEMLSEDQLVPLGTLIKSGNECEKSMVSLAKSLLDRHVFVAGVTGSGKTTTCQTLLLSSGWPFLVIEPAKTEYRGLRHADKEEIRAQCKNLLVFTLGDDTVAPFRLNPFELIPGESVTARVDMLMASISAAFEMEAAIPQLIERAIYACYEDYGWSLDTNENEQYEDPFKDGVFAFPTLSDVLKKTETVVNEQGFDDRLKKDYIGSINARLQGLTLGSKGFMLDCPRSIDFVKLLDRQVVLELESIPNAAQKSLIIGFVLTNLLQAVKYKFKTGGGKIHHITLIEEAHRLLSKPEPGGSPSQKQAAETFADMLAEIRKYGESLVIADQIPGKLTPEVMKNTNTKIIHRLFAQDDKEAVGHTMGLDDDQAKFLSNLVPGRAIVFNGDWSKAVQVQIAQKYRTDSTPENDEDTKLRDAALAFYAKDFRRGVYGMSQLFAKEPTGAELEAKAKSLQRLSKAFRSCDGIPAKVWNPLIVPRLCERYGESAVSDVLSSVGVQRELADIADKSIKVNDLKLPVLLDLCEKHTDEVVLHILLARRYVPKTIERTIPRYIAFLSDFRKKNFREIPGCKTKTLKCDSRECLYAH